MELPRGFRYSGVACQIKPSGKPDLALVVMPQGAVAAGVYTQNVVRAASIDWNRGITPTGDLRAIVVNSGNANACTGETGVANNRTMAATTAERLDCTAEQVAVLSTGVIGRPLPMDKVNAGIVQAMIELGEQPDDFIAAAKAITTTDQSSKTASCCLSAHQGAFTIAGMAKGAGMIGPNMATLLAIVCTDLKVTPELAQSLVTRAAEASFNRISVEGHTSTNDALLLVCSGASGIELVADDTELLAAVQQSLDDVCLELAKKIPADGEGASHLVEIEIRGARDQQQADQIARSVAASNLVKTAVAGSDPNWGRIVSAAGYSGAEMDVTSTELTINGFSVFADGQPVEFDESRVSQAMREQFQTSIVLTVGTGPGTATHWTSDLTVEYVRFNSEYTT